MAFGSCFSLTVINVDATNTAYSSVDGVLYDKNKTALLQYPAGKTGAFTIPGSVTSIGNWAFFSCFNLTRITIPGSVTSIGNRAFAYCTRLVSITIPSSVTSIGDHAFSECILTSVTFEGEIDTNLFQEAAFDGDLRTKFYATDPTNGTPGTYTRASGSFVWTKQ
jgi:hypothetical protein